MKKLQAWHGRVVLLAALLVLYQTFPAGAGVWEGLQQLRRPGERAGEVVTYTPPEWPVPLNADLYLPADATQTLQLRPVVLLLHGGDWRRGDKGSQKGLARALSGQGYAVFAINYRLAPGARHPAQLQDMQQALRWLRDHAEEYRLDMKRLAAWGYSAGGHLAALLGVQPPSDLPALRVVIAGGTPFDLRDPAVVAGTSVQELIGGTPQELPALYEQASPMARVRPGLPAFFVYHGTADARVPPAIAEDFAGALAVAGVAVELVWLEGLTHEAAATTGNIMPLALDWLELHIGAAAAAPDGLQTRGAPARLIRMAYRRAGGGADAPAAAVPAHR